MTNRAIDKRYLQSGKQTEITPAIRETISNIKGGGLKFIEEAYKWIKENIPYKKDKNTKSKVFRKRTANQILQDKYLTGCTDTALLFISFCRAKGIPTKYVEAVKKDSDGSQGHIFAECLIDDRWFVVDPANVWHKKNYNYKDFDIIARGLDSWDIETGSLKKIISKTRKFRKKAQLKE